MSGVEVWRRVTGVEVGEKGEAKVWGADCPPVRPPERFSEGKSVAQTAC